MYNIGHLHQLKGGGSLMMETHLVLHISRSMIDYVVVIFVHVSCRSCYMYMYILDIIMDFIHYLCDVVTCYYCGL